MTMIVIMILDVIHLSFIAMVTIIMMTIIVVIIMSANVDIMMVRMYVVVDIMMNFGLCMPWVLFNVAFMMVSRSCFDRHIDMLCSVSHWFIVNMLCGMFHRLVVNMSFDMSDRLKFSVSSIVLMFRLRVIMMSRCVMMFINEDRCWLFDMLNMVVTMTMEFRIMMIVNKVGIDLSVNVVSFNFFMMVYVMMDIMVDI